MKTPFVFLSILIGAVLLAGCVGINIPPDAQSVTPSSNRVTETRAVSGFNGVDMRAFGQVSITLGDQESLVVSGSDNLVPLVKTYVSNGILVIEMDHVSVQSFNTDDVLAFEITVKDLTSLAVSGLGNVEMPALETASLDLDMSGAGSIKIDNLAADSVLVNVGGLGNVTLAGTANHADVQISGAGEIDAGSLACKTIRASVPGLGTATVWVTDDLSGEISGAGSVRYYGDPNLQVNATGLGRFDSLGSK